MEVALRPGSLLSERYQLVEKIGAGGMGAVWLAKDLALDATCAVKVVRAELASNREVRARFVREAKLAAQLRSPHVVDVFDFGESNGVLYIVMAWLEGESLGDRLARVGRLDAATTHRVIAHVARALTAAHEIGIVHRDLKPDNVFLVPGYDEETAKVLDFGIAHHSVYAMRDRATRAGTLLGTPCYLSPEQACGKPVDHRSDLWSLGVIGFECLTGHSPFDADSIGEVMGRVLYDALPSATALNAALPLQVDAWWRRAACRDPDGRFQSAEELVDELAGALWLERSVTVAPPGRSRTRSFATLPRSSGIYLPEDGEHSPSSPSSDIGPASLVDLSGFRDGPPTLPADAGTLPANADTLVAEQTPIQDWLAARLASLRGAEGWLVWALPALLVLVAVTVWLALSSRAPESSPVTLEREATVSDAPELVVAPVPDPKDLEHVVPSVPLESLPRAEGGATAQGGVSGRGRHGRRTWPGFGRPLPSSATPATPAPHPSTRDYGI